MADSGITNGSHHVIGSISSVGDEDAKGMNKLTSGILRFSIVISSVPYDPVGNSR
jgi:hypothetical protein